MNTLLHITAKVNQPVLLQYKVEKLAGTQHRPSPQTRSSAGQWLADDTASVEAFVEGGLSFNCRGQILHMPFATPFLFTCTADDSTACKLAWSQSLS